MLWFTSDEHYGHSNIIKYCDRPFANADEMAQEIINRHNSLVSQGDHVYHLGDVTFQLEAEWYIRQLNGIHHLILGNHDHNSFHKRQRPGVYQSIQEAKQVNWNGYKFYLSHYACRTWPNSHRGALHLYGHSHGTLPGFGRSMDVGVDTNNFYPYSGTAVVEQLGNVDFIGVDHHL